MLNYLINSVVSIVSSLLGAISGLGGGMIIKPVLAITNVNNAFTINFLSTTTILFMTCLSTGKNIKNKTLKFHNNYLYLIFGAAIGGFIGAYLFEYLLEVINDDDTVQSIQSFIKLIIIFIFGVILQRMHIKYKLKESFLSLILSGIFAGLVSSFLAIGGGLVNIFIFTKLLKIKLKDAINLSLLAIIFSQLISLLILILGKQQFDSNIIVILLMWIGAFIGVQIGDKIKNNLNEKKLETVYTIIVSLITLLNVVVVLLPFIR